MTRKEIDIYVSTNFRLFTMKEMAKRSNVRYSLIYNSVYKQKLKKTNLEKQEIKNYCYVSDSFKAKKIIEKVSAISGISIDDIIGKSRKLEIITPRFFAIQLIKENTRLPLQYIGKQFSGRNHATIINAMKIVANISSYNVKYKASLDKLRIEIEDYIK
jgi:chromosomal replication initiation ATPase DnaA